MPGKLVLAAVPLVLALIGVSALYVQSAFAEADEELAAVQLAAVLVDVRNTVDALAIEAEDPPTHAAETDARLTELRSSVNAADAPPLARQLDAAVRRLALVRAGAPEGDFAGYDQVAGDLLSIASLVPAEVANKESARALEGVSAIGRARQVARVQDRAITVSFPLNEADRTTLERIRSLQLDFTGWVDLFHTVASAEARTLFAQSGAPVTIGGVSTQVSRVLTAEMGVAPISEADWNQLLDERAETLGVFEERLTETVRRSADAAAAQAATRAWIVVTAAIGSLVLAAVMTALISGSIVRRVRGITERAQHVAQEQLPALVEALRDPSEDSVLPSIPPMRDRGADEIGDLARSFSALQSTLEDVAAQQVETLRKGVADMFVTLARRNRSLIDRQLVLIDELESDEEDPAALADFYRLDHMATRMRRNSESLLVLAGNEPPRTWRTPLGVDDVVRAAIGEIEDYRRVDVLTLESVQLKGTVVADLSHLLSELLENAAHFSPPQTRVRISGHFHEEGYLLTVADRGVGVPQSRLSELNALLEKPPVIGLALEPFLGLYVVAMLARRHGIQVRLVPGAPGISAKLLIPPTLYEAAPVPESIDEAPSRPGESEPPFGRRRTVPVPTPATSPAPPAPVPIPRWGPPSKVTNQQPQVETGSGPAVSPVELQPATLSLAQPEESTGPPALPARVPVAPSWNDGPHAVGADLPVRRPGSAFEADPTSERPVVTQPARTPDAVRSSFGAFQTGLAAGRREVSEGDEE
ncbi:MAG: nitrate- and nitrite sensing domain-containing protein [Acidimicrobiia bacterium]